ncbi:MAG: hypothetical protein AB7Y46_02955 [Armatimonadota bacterium]
MNETLTRWLERNRVQGEARKQMAQCLSEPAESSVAAYLFAGSETDEVTALEKGAKHVAKFATFAREHDGQARRLRDLVARLPHAPQRWREFIEHELARPKSAWVGVREAAEALAASFGSAQVGEWILGYVYSAEHRNDLDPERLPALAVEWKRRVFLALVDPIIAQAKAQEGAPEQ